MSVVEIFGLSLIEIVGDFALKQYANGGTTAHLIVGIIGYVGGGRYVDYFITQFNRVDGKCRVGWDECID